MCSFLFVLLCDATSYIHRIRQRNIFLIILIEAGSCETVEKHRAQCAQHTQTRKQKEIDRLAQLHEEMFYDNGIMLLVGAVTRSRGVTFNIFTGAVDVMSFTMPLLLLIFSFEPSHILLCLFAKYFRSIADN